MAYSAGAIALAAFLVKKRLALSRQLLSLLLLVLGATFFVDQAAESRALWKFPTLRLGSALDVPVENLAFTLATAIYSLSCYLFPSVLRHGRRGRSISPTRPSVPLQGEEA